MHVIALAHRVTGELVCQMHRVLRARGRHWLKFAVGATVGVSTVGIMFEHIEHVIRAINTGSWLEAGETVVFAFWSLFVEAVVILKGFQFCLDALSEIFLEASDLSLKGVDFLRGVVRIIETHLNIH